MFLEMMYKTKNPFCFIYDQICPFLSPVIDSRTRISQNPVSPKYSWNWSELNTLFVIGSEFNRIGCCWRMRTWDSMGRVYEVDHHLDGIAQQCNNGERHDDSGGNLRGVNGVDSHAELTELVNASG